MKLSNTKLYLLKKRDEIIRLLQNEGFNGEDIAFIMNRNRSTISDVINNRTARAKKKKQE